jgi:hypothetical protein
MIQQNIHGHNYENKTIFDPWIIADRIVSLRQRAGRYTNRHLTARAHRDAFPNRNGSAYANVYADPFANHDTQAACSQF